LNLLPFFQRQTEQQSSCLLRTFSIAIIVPTPPSLLPSSTTPQATRHHHFHLHEREGRKRKRKVRNKDILVIIIIMCLQNKS
jgi:hypothetical protein